MLDFLNHSADSVAPQLIGWRLMREINGVLVGGTIVETEAYTQTDAASHSFKGKTPRTEIMFGRPGFAYVYFTYGMHYCMNVVTGEEGDGSAVLIRALEPTEGLGAMKQLRRGKEHSELTNGPAKLCQALCIDKALNGHDLTQSPLWLEPPAENIGEIVTSTRIGISKNTDKLWRYYLKDNTFVSKT